MVITLAEDLTTAALTEFDAVDTSGFRFVSFLAKGNFVGEPVDFRFSTQAGKFSDDIPKSLGGSCTLTDGAAQCFNPTGSANLHRIAGPFLLVKLGVGNNTTLQVFLSN